MRVPGPVKAVFDKFPLAQHEEITDNTAVAQPKTQLFVYNSGPDKIALDPNGLAAQTLMKVIGIQTAVSTGSPYMSNKEVLPLLVQSGSEKRGLGVYHGLGEIVAHLLGTNQFYGSEMELFEIMIEKWLGEAWLATILNVEYEQQCLRIYSSDKDRSQPWPANKIINNQLFHHLGTQSKHGVVRKFNSHTAAMALQSLSTRLGNADYFEIGVLNASKISLLDILVYSYIWSILKHVPNSPLAALVPTSLAEHAHRVHKSVYISNE